MRPALQPLRRLLGESRQSRLSVTYLSRTPQILSELGLRYDVHGKDIEFNAYVPQTKVLFFSLPGEDVSVRARRVKSAELAVGR